MTNALPEGWQPWVALVLLLVDVAVSLHVVLHKRDVRAAISWVGLIWLAPVAGVLLYGLFGLNRIRRQAIDIQRARRLVISRAAPEGPDWLLATTRPRLAGLARVTERLSGRQLLGGNSIAPLRNGDEAYPAMLAAIDGATTSVALCSYIFANDAAGSQFVAALARAAQRGVQVRVLVDGVGARYTWPPVRRALKRTGVPVALFLPIVSRTGIAFFNLRTHRKVLVVDGSVAFAGGMNIQAANVWSRSARPGDRRIRDVHFRVLGPVVQQLLDAFAEDWAFVTGEVLEGPAWRVPVERRGTIGARVIASGPDRDFEIVRNVLLAAVASARESVSIVTPYFLPDASMVASLAVAALRGVRVDIVLPERGNIPVADWATRAMLWQLLKPGCRVHLTPPPFDHAKLLVIDRSWTLIGTTNWDPRSLRLNFELDVECYDERFATDVQALVDERIAGSRPYTLADADGRSFMTRVRDGIARLLSPYL